MRILILSLLLCAGCAGKPAPTPTASATPSAFEQHKALGLRLSEATAWGAAIPELEAARKINPTDVDVQYHLLRCLRKDEEHPNPKGPAAEAARQVIKLKGTPDQIKQAQDYLKVAEKTGNKLAGLKYVEEGKYRQAIPLLVAACQRDPKDASARLGLFLAYANTEIPGRSNHAYECAGRLHSMVAPGSPEALRALEYRHAVEFGWGGTPTEVLHKYLSALKNLRDPKQLVYFYPMNLNHRAKEGANILAQQEELRIKVAALLAQVFSRVNLVVLGQKINGNSATQDTNHNDRSSFRFAADRRRGFQDGARGRLVED